MQQILKVYEFLQQLVTFRGTWNFSTTPYFTEKGHQTRQLFKNVTANMCYGKITVLIVCKTSIKVFAGGAVLVQLVHINCKLIKHK